MIGPQSAEPVAPLLERLTQAQVAGCSCLTKTPEVRYHDPLCHFRLHFESYQEIHMLQTALKEWEQKGAGLKSEDLVVLREYLR